MATDFLLQVTDKIKFMNNNRFYKTVLYIAIPILFFTACKKDEARIYYNNGTSPILTATVTSGDTLPLIPADSLNTAIGFSWTNPNYNFSNGISSLNVTYYLEVDTVGANFSSKNMQTIAINSALDTSFNVTKFNAIVGNGLQVSFGQPHNIQVRVVSFLAPQTSPTLSNSTTLYSNVLNYIVTPYAPPPAVAPPSSGTLFITGSATPDSWMVGGTASSVTSPVNQQLTQVPGSNGLVYTITLPLTGGQQFLLVPVAGDWSNKYATSSSSPATTGGTFGYNAANNFNGPAVSGTYTVTVNFQTGIYTISQ